MTYRNKIKFCRQVNSDPIYQEYSCGIKCCCFRDCHGAEHLQVMHLTYHKHLDSSICNGWEEHYILEWIMHATRSLKDMLDLGVEI